MSFYVFQFVEGSKEAHFDGAVLLGFGQCSAVGLRPHSQSALWKENADGISEFAVGGDVEDEFSCGRFRIVLQRISLSHEVVLVDVPLRPSVGLHPTNGHGDIMERRWHPCRGPPQNGTTESFYRFCR